LRWTRYIAFRSPVPAALLIVRFWHEIASVGNSMQVVLITGTSRGLGLELAKYYLDMGNTLIGISRSGPPIENSRYHHCCVDVTEESSTEVLRKFIDSLSIGKIDILINNAGTGGYGFHFSEVNPTEILNQVNLHCIGALRVTQAAHRYLDHSKVVNVTSRLGSIRQNERGDFTKREFSYSYRIAKCSQNMLSLCMANDPELAGTTVISLNPGLLRTASGSDDASYTAKEGAVKVAEVVSSAGLSGMYHAFGEEAVY
jgi:NAD(P)-dependent dehydrogenase (short-subunit alcohol dehydrogenase family)